MSLVYCASDTEGLLAANIDKKLQYPFSCHKKSPYVICQYVYYKTILHRIQMRIVWITSQCLQLKGLFPSSSYRPQTKFAKVMILHVSVCPQGRGEYLVRYLPWVGTPPGRFISQAGTPPRQVPPGQVQTPPPRAVHASRYGQQVGGTHPTGMHSCVMMF